MNRPFNFYDGWSDAHSKWKRLRDYEKRTRKKMKRAMDESFSKLEEISKAIDEEIDKRVADGRINPKDPDYIEAKANFKDLAATRDMFFLYQEAKNNPELADEILKEFTREEEE